MTISLVSVPVKRAVTTGHESMSASTAVLGGSLTYEDVDVSQLTRGLSQPARGPFHLLPRLTGELARGDVLTCLRERSVGGTELRVRFEQFKYLLIHSREPSHHETVGGHPLNRVKLTGEYRCVEEHRHSCSPVVTDRLCYCVYNYNTKIK